MRVEAAPPERRTADHRRHRRPSRCGGDDNTNLNDEWVRFTNAGTAPLDFNGWIVGDESSSHRYTFTDLVVEPGAAVTLFTGCGIDTTRPSASGAIRLRGWNNAGDTVFLHDPAGNIVASHGY